MDVLGFVLDRKGSVVAVAYIRGRTRVKGVSNKEVYYVGDVEKDGYIYFGDDIAYRCPTPATQNLETQVNLADLQIWYTVRNCWIRANYFTNLTAYWFDPEDMYNRIEDHERRITSLEARMSAVEQRLTALEGRVSDLEVRMTNVENRVSDLESRMTNVENRVSNLEERMTRTENNIITLTNALNAAVNRIATLEGKVTVLEAWRVNLTHDLGDFSSILNAYGSLWGYIQHEVSVMNHSIQTTSATLASYDTRISQNSSDIIDLTNAILSIDGLINLINNNIDRIDTNINAIDLAISLLEDANNLLSGRIDSTIETLSKTRRVIDEQIYPDLNFIGDKAFNVNGSSSGWLKSKVNECVRTINNLHQTSIQEETVIWEHNWTTHQANWNI